MMDVCLVILTHNDYFSLVVEDPWNTDNRGVIVLQSWVGGKSSCMWNLVPCYPFWKNHEFLCAKPPCFVVQSSSQALIIFYWLLTMGWQNESSTKLKKTLHSSKTACRHRQHAIELEVWISGAEETEPVQLRTRQLTPAVCLESDMEFDTQKESDDPHCFDEYEDLDEE